MRQKQISGKELTSWINDCVSKSSWTSLCLCLWTRLFANVRDWFTDNSTYLAIVNFIMSVTRWQWRPLAGFRVHKKLSIVARTNTSWLEMLQKEWNCYELCHAKRIQSTLDISKSKRLSEVFLDICTSTYQICRIEAKINRTTTFHKWIRNLTPEVRDILKIMWKRGEIGAGAFSSLFHNILLPVVRFSCLNRDQIFSSR